MWDCYTSVKFSYTLTLLVCGKYDYDLKYVIIVHFNDFFQSISGINGSYVVDIGDNKLNLAQVVVDTKSDWGNWFVTNDFLEPMKTKLSNPQWVN